MTDNTAATRFSMFTATVDSGAGGELGGSVTVEFVMDSCSRDPAIAEVDDEG